MQNHSDLPHSMAERFLKLAQDNKIDPAVGFILQIPPMMQDSNSAFGRVTAFCADNGITVTPEFFQDLTGYIEDNDIAQITPMQYVVSKTKATTLSMYLEVSQSWGVHIPFFFQTRLGSAFFIYRTAPDALHAMLDILTNRKVIYTKPVDGCRVPLTVDYILEHIVGDNPCYALFDLDEYPHRYQGRISDSEVNQLLISGFPARFTLLLLESGCLDEEAVTEVIFKNRSRWCRDKGVNKTSYHLRTSLFGSKAAHRQAVAAALQLPFDANQKLEDWLKRVNDADDYSMVPIEEFTCKDRFGSLPPFDLSAPPGGSNGITTFYSKKNCSDPFPVYSHTSRFCLGIPISMQQSPFPMPHDIRSTHLTVQQKLRMLYKMSYTIPQGFMTFYSDSHTRRTQYQADGERGQNQEGGDTGLAKEQKVNSYSFFIGHAGGSNPTPFMRVNPDAWQIGG